VLIRRDTGLSTAEQSVIRSDLHPGPGTVLITG
jgi:hypothetical protein